MRISCDAITPRRAPTQGPILRYEFRGNYCALVPNQRDIILPEDTGAFEEESRKYPSLETTGLPYCVDLTCVRHLASPVLGSLIALNARIEKAVMQPRQGARNLAEKLSLIVSEPTIFEVLVITKLDRLFGVSISREDYERALSLNFSI